MAAHPLTDTYTQGRAGLLALARTLSERDGAVMSTACPQWSIKDIYAHLAGISTDILAGNTEKAATVEWADGHVSERRDASLADVVDEWASAGPGVSDLMSIAGEAFPFQLFLDQWTHEWDIRSALAERAAARPDLTVWRHFLDDMLARVADRSEAPRALDLEVDGRVQPIGAGESAGRLTIDPFSFARLSMGRRSRRQIDALDWPAAVAAGDRDPYIEALVFWSVNPLDVVDPVLS